MRVVSSSHLTHHQRANKHISQTKYFAKRSIRSLDFYMNPIPYQLPITFRLTENLFMHLTKDLKHTTSDITPHFYNRNVCFVIYGFFQYPNAP